VLSGANVGIEPAIRAERLRSCDAHDVLVIPTYAVGCAFRVEQSGLHSLEVRAGDGFTLFGRASQECRFDVINKSDRGIAVGNNGVMNNERMVACL